MPCFKQSPVQLSEKLREQSAPPLLAGVSLQSFKPARGRGGRSLSSTGIFLASMAVLLKSGPACSAWPRKAEVKLSKGPLLLRSRTSSGQRKMPLVLNEGQPHPIPSQVISHLGKQYPRSRGWRTPFSPFSSSHNEVAFGMWIGSWLACPCWPLVSRSVQVRLLWVHACRCV